MNRSEEIPLEKALRLAANTAANRPEFCRVLLQALVFILADRPDEKGLETADLLDKDVKIEHWQKQDGTFAIPFFSSLELLKKAVPEKRSYLALPARSLFEMTTGANLVLNPGSFFSEEFSPEEITNLLSGGATHELSERMLETYHGISLVEPEHYPERMVESLRQLLATHKNVKRAYVGYVQYAATESSANFLICLDVEGDSDLLFREVGIVVGDTAPEGNPVDLCRMGDEGSSMGQLFINKVTPFYER